MSGEIHFVQAADGPVLIASGAETLACGCGNPLVQGYDPARFLAIGLQCGRCGRVTETPPLAAGRLPPRSAIVASASSQPRTTAMTVPPDVAVVGEAEMRRLRALFQPASPDPTYHLSDALLNQVEAAVRQHTGAPLPSVTDDAVAGLRAHALGWAVGHLRAGMRAGTSPRLDDPVTANAVTHVTGFLHFVATWSQHPLFPVMAETAAERGFSLHGLAPFAAAHCLTMLGNQVRFPESLGYPQRIADFALVAGGDLLDVRIALLERFEYPFARPWDPSGLAAAVADLLGSAQGQINLRHPGLLVVSPGAALPGFDEALIEAIKAGVQVFGRKNRGLMAAAPVVLRLQALPDPRAVRFGYGFFPIVNRHYRGPGLLQTGGQPA